MADETDDDDVSQMDGETDAGDETEAGTEGDEGFEGLEKKEAPPPPPTELHNSVLFMAKYLDQKLDKLFAATEKINTDMTEMEKRIMTTFENTMKIEHDAVFLKIVAIENLLDAQGKMICDGDKKASQQANQLDELQNQEGAESGYESQPGTEEGPESEASTESEAGGETTEGEETEGEEEAEEEE
ncbi:unnamed protein product [Calypogeia fissa]